MIPTRRTPYDLNPTLADRLSAHWRAGPARPLILRRFAAAALLAAAAVAAVSEDGAPPTVPVIVAAVNLPAGHQLTPADLTTAQISEPLTPEGSHSSAEGLLGQLLAVSLAAGEPVLSLRLLGPELAILASEDPAAVIVPLRLPDAGVAALLRQGTLVDVLEIEPAVRVLARSAVVLMVETPAPSGGLRDIDASRLIAVAVSDGLVGPIVAAAARGAIGITLRGG